MKILSVDVNDIQIGKVQLRPQQGAIEFGKTQNEPISDVAVDDVKNSSDMNAVREHAYLEGLEKAETELQNALNELHVKHEANAAMHLKQHQNALSNLNDVAESLRDTVNQFKDKSYDVCLLLSFEAIVKILGNSVHDKTLIASICKSVCDEYSGLDCTIGLSRHDYPQIESLNLPLKVMSLPELKPGQCRVVHGCGYDDTGIDVRLELIKDRFLKSLLVRG